MRTFFYYGTLFSLRQRYLSYITHYYSLRQILKKTKEYLRGSKYFFKWSQQNYFQLANYSRNLHLKSYLPATIITEYLRISSQTISQNLVNPLWFVQSDSKIENLRYYTNFLTILSRFKLIYACILQNGIISLLSCRHKRE